MLRRSGSPIVSILNPWQLLSEWMISKPIALPFRRMYSMVFLLSALLQVTPYFSPSLVYLARTRSPSIACRNGLAPTRRRDSGIVNLNATCRVAIWNRFGKKRKGRLRVERRDRLMNSATTAEFRRLFAQQPEPIRMLARRCFLLWLANPQHSFWPATNRPRNVFPSASARLPRSRARATGAGAGRHDHAPRPLQTPRLA